MESSTRCVWRHLWVLASSYLGLYHHDFDANIDYNHIYTLILSQVLCAAMGPSICRSSPPPSAYTYDQSSSYNRQNAPQACRSPLRWPSASGHRGHTANFGTSVPTPHPVPPKCGSRDNSGGIFKSFRPIRRAMPHRRAIGRKSM